MQSPEKQTSDFHVRYQVLTGLDWCVPLTAGNSQFQPFSKS
jgi:hypothetical protein